LFLGIYEVDFHFFNGNAQQFNDSMNAAYNALYERGEFCKDYNLAYNLIYWISYVFEYDIGNDANGNDYNDLSFSTNSDDDNGGITLSLTGTARDVFNLKDSHAQISGLYSHCNVTGYGIYDYANALYTASYVYDSYIHAQCDILLNPQALGYNPKINDNVFSINLDVNSFSIAIAVNMGVLEVESLGLITSVAPLEVNFEGVVYYFVQVFDIRFSSMHPILCSINGSNVASYLKKYAGTAAFSGYSNVDINKNSYNRNGTLNENELCFSLMGGIIGLPVLNHIGSSHYSPSYCDCESSVGKTEPCQQFNLLASLIYYNQPITPFSLNSTQKEAFIIEQLKDGLSLVFDREAVNSDKNITTREAYETVRQRYRSLCL
jgi:hypothetical protein